MTPIDLETAYQLTEATIRQHSKSFYLATSWLPKPERQAIRALYAFCRQTDDLVDDPAAVSTDSLPRDLETWQRLVNRPPQAQQDDPILRAWADTRARYAVPTVYADELIEGCAMDLTRVRYETFAELERYCYCVAATVGLMAMHVLGTAPGVSFDEARPYAIQLGVALQMTNVLRDIGEDARERGRIYLPREDMLHFGVAEDDVLCGRQSTAMTQLLQFEIARTHQLYEAAWPGIGLLARKAHFSVAIAAETYRGILNKIVANGYDVFSRRAHLTASQKLRLLPGIWLRTRRMNPSSIVPLQLKTQDE